MKDNKERAELIGKLIEVYAQNPKDDHESNVKDLLTDIRHFCDVHDLAYSELDRAAHRNYLEEWQEDPSKRTK